MAILDGVDEPVHDMHRGLALLEEGVQTMLQARAWSLPTGEVRGALERAHVLRQRLDAVVLHLVRASTAGDDGAAPGRETRQWLQSRLRMSAGQARTLVETAAVADPEDGPLRELGKALEGGTTTLQHLDHARRAVEKLPSAIMRTRREEVGTTLAAVAERLTGPQMATACRHLVGTLAPASQDRLDPLLRERRFLEYSLSGAGVLRGTFLLEGIDAAAAKAVLDHLSAPTKEAPPGGGEGAAPLPGTVDTRTLGQRRADALAAALRLAQSSPEVGTRGGEPPHLLIHTTVEQLAWHRAFAKQPGAVPPGLPSCEQTGPMSLPLLQRAACDAVHQVVILDRTGAVVEMRTPQRLATRAMRRALAARDRGCVWPGCDVPSSGCDAHHVVWWSRGGPTCLSNLCLVCPRHHTEIHLEEWRIEMREGLPWFRPPKWVDPDQQPVRNNLHEHVAAIERFAQQVTLDLGPFEVGTGEEAGASDPDPPG